MKRQQKRHVGVSLGFVLSMADGGGTATNATAIARLPQGEIISLMVDAPTIALGLAAPQVIAERIFMAVKALREAGLDTAFCHVSTYHASVPAPKVFAAKRTLGAAMARLNEGQAAWWRIYVAAQYRPPLAGMLAFAHVTEFWGATPTDRHTARNAGVTYYSA